MRNWSHYCVRGTWFVIISLVLADWARGPRYCIRHAQATIGHHRLGHFTTSHRLLDSLISTDGDKRKTRDDGATLAAGWTTSIFTAFATCQMTLGCDVPCAACVCVCVYTTLYLYPQKNSRKASEVNLTQLHLRVAVTFQCFTFIFPPTQHFLNRKNV